MAVKLSQLHGIKDYVETSGVYEGVSSLWLALDRGPQYSEIALMLDRSGAKDSIPTQGAIEGYSVLIKALNTNNFNIALSLINKGAKDSIIATGESAGVSALWMSVYKGHECSDVQRILAYLVARKLISIGASNSSPECGEFKGDSALSILMIAKQYELANMLVNNGATDSIIQSGSFAGISTLWLALSSDGKCDDIANSLIYRGAVDSIGLNDDFAGDSTLLRAINSNNYSIAKILIERGAKDSIKISGPHNGMSTLFLALAHKQFDLAKSLIKGGAKNNVIQSGNMAGMSPLWLALELSELNIEANEIATTLAEDAEDSVPSQMFKGNSTLIRAINSRRPDIALKLLSKGAKDSVIADGGPHDGLSALWLAIDRQYLDIAFKLLDAGAIDYIPPAPEFRFFSVLMITLLTAYKEKNELNKKKYITIAKALIARGAIDSVTVNNGVSALFLALSMNENEIVDSLLERGAKDTMILTGPLKGQTVISLAIEMEKYHVILKLLEYNICGENKDILKALYLFSEKVIKCLLNLQVNGQDDPIFDQLKRYACPISLQLITYTITMSEDGYTYDRCQIQKLLNNSDGNAVSPMSRVIFSGEIPKMNRMISDELIALIKKAGDQLSEYFNKIDNAVDHSNDEAAILVSNQEPISVPQTHEQYIAPTHGQSMANVQNNHEFYCRLLMAAGVFGVAALTINSYSHMLSVFTTKDNIISNIVNLECITEIGDTKQLIGYLSEMPASVASFIEYYSVANNFMISHGLLPSSYEIPSISDILNGNFAGILPEQDNGSLENVSYIVMPILGAIFVIERLYRLYNKMLSENDLPSDNINTGNVSNSSSIHPGPSLSPVTNIQDLESENRMLAARREAERLLDVEKPLNGNNKYADAHMMEGEEAKNSTKTSYNFG